MIMVYPVKLLTFYFLYFCDTIAFQSENRSTLFLKKIKPFPKAQF